MDVTDSATRTKIMHAALKEFAHRGYSGASVQSIVNAARVTKPTLYYYFKNKAALYQALVDTAHDERYRIMKEAAGVRTVLREKLVEILTTLFEFLTGHRELMRLAFATAFASRGELPPRMNFRDKPQRNFAFIRSLIKRAQANGQLNRQFKSQELAYGFYGLMNIYVMAYLILPKQRLNRKTAERIVELFLNGAEKNK